jgi:hypothetical protein
MGKKIPNFYFWLTRLNTSDAFITVTTEIIENVTADTQF